MKLYYHKTDGGAEYLTDKYIVSPNGEKEGVFEGAKYIVRIDGDIEKDAELLIKEDDKMSEEIDYPKCKEMPFFYNGTHRGVCEQDPSMCDKCKEKYRESVE